MIDWQASKRLHDIVEHSLLELINTLIDTFINTFIDKILKITLAKNINSQLIDAVSIDGAYLGLKHDKKMPAYYK